MSGHDKVNDKDKNGDLSYEVDEKTEDGNPAAAAQVTAAEEQLRPAASLLGAERDLHAKQDARSRMAGATAARATSNSRLSQMEEDALSKARASRSTTNVRSGPGAVASSPPPATLQSLETDLETKNRAFSGRGSVVNPSVAAATAAARRVAQEHAASSREVMGNQNEKDRDFESENIPIAYMTRPTSNDPIPMTMDTNVHTAWASNDNENAAVSVVAAPNQTAVTPFVASSVPNTAPVAPLAVLQSHDSYDDSTDVVDVNPIEAFVAGGNVVDAAGVAVVLDEEEEKQLEERKLRRWLIYGCIGLVIAILIILIPSVLLIGKGGSKREVSPTMTPSQVPSMAPSFAPTAAFFTTLESQLAPHSGSAVFQDRTSPQFSAVQWMTTFESDVRALSNDKVLQLYSLAVFYFAMGGDKWKSCGRQQSGCSESTGSQGSSNWLTTANVCSWYVVTCVNSAVEAIQFATPGGAGLSGTLPYELFLLSSLKSLFINGESLSGTIPHAIAKLTNLQTLILPSNQLTGTIPDKQLGQLKQLQTLFLHSNGLNGTIPTTLGLLPLNDLRVSQNELTGTIPTEIGSISSLVNLYVDGNLLGGTIPAQIFTLKNLTAIIAYGNKNLAGTIPNSIASLTKAIALHLGDSKIGGTLPDGLFSLTQLTSLQLNNASFSGTLSKSFGNLNLTMILDLSDNKFHGAIPTSFALLDHLNILALQGNDLTGSIVTSWCNRTGYFGLQNATVDCQKVSCACCNCPA